MYIQRTGQNRRLSLALLLLGGACGGDLSDIEQLRQRNTIEGSAGFTAADLGDNHGCVIRGDGKIYCWGSNQFGQLGISTSTLTSQPSLANAAAVTTSIYPLSITAGGNHSCAVDTNGTASCWGNGDSGQLGNGLSMASSSPVQFNVSGAHVRAISAGLNFTCALLVDGRVFCAGNGSAGQLGNNGGGSAVPVLVTTNGTTALTQITQIVTGDQHACALSVTGSVFCWGAANASGGAQTAVARFVTGSSSSPTGPWARAIAAGGDFSCAVMSNGTARCWGNGANGRLGNGSTATSASPVTVTGVSSAVSIGAGVSHACAVLADGSMRCWGDDSSSQVGNGATTGDVLTPTVVNPGSQVIAALGGYQHACALTQTGLFCWGSDGSGQIGDGSATTGTQSAPVGVPLPQNQTFVATPPPFGTLISSASTFHRGRILDVGDDHACMVVPAGSLVNEGNVASSAGGATTPSTNARVACWGRNTSGQLGGGTTLNQPRPRFVTTALAGAPVAVATGAEHSCALTAGGAVFCWGSGASGQIGQNTNSSVPVQVSAITNAVAITAGSNHTCALLASGEVRCWGMNSRYQLGVSNNTSTATPQAVICHLCGTNLGHVIAIAAGGEHTCAVTAAGKTYCWGRNDEGQAGRSNCYNEDPVENETNNTIEARPVEITNTCTPSSITYLGATIVSVSAGQSHSCAVTFNGDSFCWGSNIHKQVSTSTTSSFRTAQSMASRRPNVLGLSAGGNTTCALHRSASSGSAVIEVSCWGSNALRQAGDGSNPLAIVPPDVVTPLVVTNASGSALSDQQARVATGTNFACALSFNGQVNCWGTNTVGQQGRGTTNAAVYTDSNAAPVVDLQ